MKRCKAKTKAGNPCRAPAVGKNGFCFFHDPAREVERQAAREKGARMKPSRVIKLDGATAIETAAEVQSLLAAMIEDVLGGGDVRRARTAGYLAGIVLRAIELSEVERRLGELEALVFDERGMRN